MISLLVSIVEKCDFNVGKEEKIMSGHDNYIKMVIFAEFFYGENDCCINVMKSECQSSYSPL